MTRRKKTRPTAMICAGCHRVAPEDAVYPFRCTHATGGDDIDHVLVRQLDTQAVRIFGGNERNPFLRYRELFHAYHVARAHGMAEREFVALVSELDAAVAAAGGCGFTVTPWARHPELDRRLGRSGGGAVWVKDETRNVGGSHKARHLMGLMIYLKVIERLGLAGEGAGHDDAAARGASDATVGLGGVPAAVGDAVAGDAAAPPPLAIASCGNAALAAAIVAQAGGRTLDVYIPPAADPRVVARLRELGARLTTCPRAAGEQGDPCFLRFREAVARGALPFTCQGSENGLTIEGGCTLGYEIVSELARERQPLDRLFVQVGGGALASACVQAFEEGMRLGLITRLPQLHAVQTAGAWPLKRAYDRLVRRMVERFQREEWRLASEERRPPERVDLDDEEACAEYLLDRRAHAVVREELEYAATHRSEFMWPWEEEPQSIAYGILDDETYDWLAVVKGMIRSGGYPIVVTEQTLMEANQLAKETTGARPDHTGSAGLAGLLELEARGVVDPREVLGVLLTGAER